MQLVLLDRIAQFESTVREASLVTSTLVVVTRKVCLLETIKLRASFSGQTVDGFARAECKAAFKLELWQAQVGELACIVLCSAHCYFVLRVLSTRTTCVLCKNEMRESWSDA